MGEKKMESMKAVFQKSDEFGIKKSGRSHIVLMSCRFLPLILQF
jgi:hypothetical protein